MPNLRLIYDNVANAASSLTASSTAGALVAANMLTDVKVEVHRSTGTTVSYTLVWGSSQKIGAVALPATNLSVASTIRVQLYSDTAGTTLVADSGLKAACNSSQLGLHGWGSSISANAFAFGGASKTAVWFSPQPTGIRRCVITLSDPANSAGYIDCARIVAGPYWEAEINPTYGGTAGSSDLTKVQRLDSGDVAISRGAQFQSMQLNLASMGEESRAALAKIIRSAGSARNLFVSLLPEYTGPSPVLQIDGQPVTFDEGVVTFSADATAEQDHMIYGRRANGAFTFDYFNSFSTKLEIEGW